MSDLIDRQAVNDLISKFIIEIHTEGGRDLNAHTNDVLRQILRNINSDEVLPSVNPQEPCEVEVGKLQQVYNKGFEDCRKVVLDIDFHKLIHTTTKPTEMIKQKIEQLHVDPQEPKYCDRNICISNEYNGISCAECEVTKSQEPKTEKVIKMRDATSEEQKSVDEYIKSISKPTGVDFWDLDQEPCDKVISKQVVKDKYRERLVNSLKDDDRGMDLSKYAEEPYKAFCEFMDSIPPVNLQEQKTGHWIMNRQRETRQCDKCMTVYRWSFNPHNYCPNCGFRMVEPQKRSE